MRHLFILLFAILLTFGFELNAQEVVNENEPDIVEKKEAVVSTPQNTLEQAQYEYQDKNYPKAIELWNTEIEKRKKEGEVSAELYYNLGNAYFRMDEFAKAMLNYERAQLYNPGDRDIRHNIEYTQTKIEDKILVADNFFLKIWFEAIQNLLTSNTWAVLSIVLFLSFIVCLFVFLFNSNLVLKKIGFYAGIVFLISLVFTNIFSLKQKDKIEAHNTAIIMAGSAPVVSSPTGEAKDLFILHAGTKVEILKNDGDWFEIEIANGSIGWIKKEMLEII